MKIGVFDSGIGGLSVANAIEKALPDYAVAFYSDAEHVPYGNRQPTELLKLVIPIFNKMIEDGCDVIVIACNTVSTTIVGELRQKFELPIVALDPMIKPAAQLTKTGVIAVCATETTLKSQRYRELKELYASVIKVLEPDCSDWASMIEENRINEQVIGQQIKDLLDANADTIVLACTHYHWIEEQITSVATGKATVIQPEQAIIRQVTRVLQQQR